MAPPSGAGAQRSEGQQEDAARLYKQARTYAQSFRAVAIQKDNALKALARDRNDELQAKDDQVKALTREMDELRSRLQAMEAQQHGAPAPQPTALGSLMQRQLSIQVPPPPSLPPGSAPSSCRSQQPPQLSSRSGAAYPAAPSGLDPYPVPLAKPYPPANVFTSPSKQALQPDSGPAYVAYHQLQPQWSVQPHPPAPQQLVHGHYTSADPDVWCEDPDIDVEPPEKDKKSKAKGLGKALKRLLSTKPRRGAQDEGPSGGSAQPAGGHVPSTAQLQQATAAPSGPTAAASRHTLFDPRSLQPPAAGSGLLQSRAAAVQGRSSKQPQHLGQPLQAHQLWAAAVAAAQDGPAGQGARRPAHHRVPSGDSDVAPSGPQAAFGSTAGPAAPQPSAVNASPQGSSAPPPFLAPLLPDDSLYATTAPFFALPPAPAASGTAQFSGSAAGPSRPVTLPSHYLSAAPPPQPQVASKWQQLAVSAGPGPKQAPPGPAQPLGSQSVPANPGLEAVARAVHGSDLAYGRHGSSGVDLFAPNALAALRRQQQQQQQPGVPAHGPGECDAAAATVAEALLVTTAAVQAQPPVGQLDSAAAGAPGRKPGAAAKQPSEGGNVWAALVQRSAIGQVAQRLAASVPGSRRPTDSSGVGSMGGSAAAPPVGDSGGGALPSGHSSRRQSWGSDAPPPQRSTPGAKQQSAAPSAGPPACTPSSLSFRAAAAQLAQLPPRPSGRNGSVTSANAPAYPLPNGTAAPAAPLARAPTAPAPPPVQPTPPPTATCMGAAVPSRPGLEADGPEEEPAGTSATRVGSDAYLIGILSRLKTPSVIRQSITTAKGAAAPGAAGPGVALALAAGPLAVAKQAAAVAAAAVTAETGGGAGEQAAAVYRREFGRSVGIAWRHKALGMKNAGRTASFHERTLQPSLAGSANFSTAGLQDGDHEPARNPSPDDTGCSAPQLHEGGKQPALVEPIMSAPTLEPERMHASAPAPAPPPPSLLLTGAAALALASVPAITLPPSRARLGDSTPPRLSVPSPRAPPSPSSGPPGPPSGGYASPYFSPARNKQQLELQRAAALWRSRSPRSVDEGEAAAPSPGADMHDLCATRAAAGHTPSSAVVQQVDERHNSVAVSTGPCAGFDKTPAAAAPRSTDVEAEPAAPETTEEEFSSAFQAGSPSTEGEEDATVAHSAFARAAPQAALVLDASAAAAACVPAVTPGAWPGVAAVQRPQATPEATAAAALAAAASAGSALSPSSSVGSWNPAARRQAPQGTHGANPDMASCSVTATPAFLRPKLSGTASFLPELAAAAGLAAAASLARTPSGTARAQTLAGAGSLATPLATDEDATPPWHTGAPRAPGFYSCAGSAAVATAVGSTAPAGAGIGMPGSDGVSPAGAFHTPLRRWTLASEDGEGSTGFASAATAAATDVARSAVATAAGQMRCDSAGGRVALRYDEADEDVAAGEGEEGSASYDGEGEDDEDGTDEQEDAEAAADPASSDGFTSLPSCTEAHTPAPTVSFAAMARGQAPTPAFGFGGWHAGSKQSPFLTAPPPFALAERPQAAHSEAVAVWGRDAATPSAPLLMTPGVCQPVAASAAGASLAAALSGARGGVYSSGGGAHHGPSSGGGGSTYSDGDRDLQRHWRSRAVGIAAVQQHTPHPPEAVHRAALVIQARWRGVRAQRVALASAATAAVGTAPEGRRAAAAVLIQACWRRHLARRQLSEELRRRAAEEQAAYAALEELRRQEAEEQAAVRIQAAWRGSRAQKALAAELRAQAEAEAEARRLQELQAQQEAAAVAIQTAWRGSKARASTRVLRLEQREQEAARQREREQLAAVTVQAAWRGTQARQQAAALRCERAAAAAAATAAERAGREAAAAVTVQAAWRGTLARQHAAAFRAERAAAEAAAEEARRESTAAVVVQAAWRGSRVRQRAAVLRAERAAAAAAAQEQARCEAAAAVTVQAAWRGTCSRRQVAAIRAEQAAVGAAAAAAEEQARREAAAAVTVQAVWRGSRGRQHAAALRAEREAEAAAAAAALAAEQAQAEREEEAAVAVQAAWRGHRARLEVQQRRAEAEAEAEASALEQQAQLESAASRIQLAWRGYSLRRAITVEQAALAQAQAEADACSYTEGSGSDMDDEDENEAGPEAQGAFEGDEAGSEDSDPPADGDAEAGAGSSPSSARAPGAWVPGLSYDDQPVGVRLRVPPTNRARGAWGQAPGAAASSAAAGAGGLFVALPVRSAELPAVAAGQVEDAEGGVLAGGTAPKTLVMISEGISVRFPAVSPRILSTDSSDASGSGGALPAATLPVRAAVPQPPPSPSAHAVEAPVRGRARPAPIGRLARALEGSESGSESADETEGEDGRMASGVRRGGPSNPFALLNGSGSEAGEDEADEAEASDEEGVAEEEAEEGEASELEEGSESGHAAASNPFALLGDGASAESSDAASTEDEAGPCSPRSASAPSVHTAIHSRSPARSQSTSEDGGEAEDEEEDEGEDDEAEGEVEDAELDKASLAPILSSLAGIALAAAGGLLPSDDPRLQQLSTLLDQPGPRGDWLRSRLDAEVRRLRELQAEEDEAEEGEGSEQGEEEEEPSPVAAGNPFTLLGGGASEAESSEGEQEGSGSDTEGSGSPCLEPEAFPAAAMESPAAPAGARRLLPANPFALLGGEGSDEEGEGRQESAEDEDSEEPQPMASPAEPSHLAIAMPPAPHAGTPSPGGSGGDDGGSDVSEVAAGEPDSPADRQPRNLFVLHQHDDEGTGEDEMEEAEEEGQSGGSELDLCSDSDAEEQALSPACATSPQRPASARYAASPDRPALPSNPFALLGADDSGSEEGEEGEDEEEGEQSEEGEENGTGRFPAAEVSDGIDTGEGDASEGGASPSAASPATPALGAAVTTAADGAATAPSSAFSFGAGGWGGLAAATDRTPTATPSWPGASQAAIPASAPTPSLFAPAPAATVEPLAAGASGRTSGFGGFGFGGFGGLGGLWGSVPAATTPPAVGAPTFGTAAAAQQAPAQQPVGLFGAFSSFASTLVSPHLAGTSAPAQPSAPQPAGEQAPLAAGGPDSPEAFTAQTFGDAPQATASLMASSSAFESALGGPSGLFGSSGGQEAPAARGLGAAATPMSRPRARPADSSDGGEGISAPFLSYDSCTATVPYAGIDGGQGGGRQLLFPGAMAGNHDAEGGEMTLGRPRVTGSPSVNNAQPTMAGPDRGDADSGSPPGSPLSLRPQQPAWGAPVSTALPARARTAAVDQTPCSARVFSAALTRTQLNSAAAGATNPVSGAGWGGQGVGMPWAGLGGGRLTEEDEAEPAGGGAWRRRLAECDEEEEGEEGPFASPPQGGLAARLFAAEDGEEADGGETEEGERFASDEGEQVEGDEARSPGPPGEHELWGPASPGGGSAAGDDMPSA
ncbi:hypothetical protein HYH03_009250 [Edaphochlamys debaryana]|uniref:Uncharacterized protein n=1 Tax=Edaphochlamys debaryana TaxID=47281 RepID=A0A835Y7T8_9CHLO|nr:hypothetical protein HYH03_009250 [Edaphochlamys debaryana]|eukprot:KAG2492589.1 hypothetical protein HYH03_009250 [Edaphochlamys debaryana]